MEDQNSHLSCPTRWVRGGELFQFSVQYPGVMTNDPRGLTKNKAWLGIQWDYKRW